MALEENIINSSTRLKEMITERMISKMLLETLPMAPVVIAYIPHAHIAAIAVAATAAAAVGFGVVVEAAAVLRLLRQRWQRRKKAQQQLPLARASGRRRWPVRWLHIMQCVTFTIPPEIVVEVALLAEVLLLLLQLQVGVVVVVLASVVGPAVRRTGRRAVAGHQHCRTTCHSQRYQQQSLT
jgi:hypothetical protein